MINISSSGFRGQGFGWFFMHSWMGEYLNMKTIRFRTSPTSNPSFFLFFRNSMAISRATWVFHHPLVTQENPRSRLFFWFCCLVFGLDSGFIASACWNGSLVPSPQLYWQSIIPTPTSMACVSCSPLSWAAGGNDLAKDKIDLKFSLLFHQLGIHDPYFNTPPPNTIS